MNAREFIDKYGAEEVQRVVDAAGTSKQYFHHIANNYRNASLPLAQRLVEASDGRLDLMSLMSSTPDRKTA